MGLAAAGAIIVATIAGAMQYGGVWPWPAGSARDTVETGRADGEPVTDVSTRIVLPPTPPSEARSRGPDTAPPAAEDTLSAIRSPIPAPHRRTEGAPTPPPVRDTSPPRPPAGVGALERLGALRRALHPELPGDSATLILRELGRLVPLLRTARDSVDAAILQAEAYGKLERYEDACAILEGARRSASPRQQEKIRLWADRGVCPASAWTES